MQGRWKMVVIVVVAFALGGAAVAAVAANRTPHGLVTRTAAGGVTKVAVAQSKDASTFASTSGLWKNFTGAKVTIKVPPKQKALFLATFSGETICNDSGGFVADECDLRIVVDGNEMSPGPVSPNNGAAFDSHGAGNDYREMHAIQRSRVVGPGTHTVQVQVKVGSTGFTVQAWLLSVISAKVG